MSTIFTFTFTIAGAVISSLFLATFFSGPYWYDALFLIGISTAILGVCELLSHIFQKK